MPIVRITLSEDRPRDTWAPLSEAIHAALVETVKIPNGDRFHVVAPVPAEAMFFDRRYMNMDRQDVVCIEITLVEGRSAEVKSHLFQAIAQRLEQLGVRADDVFVTLTENSKADWSVGRGLQQLVNAVSE